MASIIETVSGIADYAKSKNIAHLHTQNEVIRDNRLLIANKDVVNFASCSYLGLEFHSSLKKNSIDAIDRFGTQFSSSRAYLSLGIYQELTQKLDKIFGGHTVVTPTTTLGHLAAIPVITSSNDLIVLDHQVHNSVQMAVQNCKAKGTTVRIIRHNNLEALEKILDEERENYERIWYMADGIYSMYGDKAPIHEINDLLDKYPSFNLYIDDAHAMSCFGERGQGYVLSEIDITEKIIVGTSLNKAFASGGGAIICGKKEWAELIMKCGGPMITSGPMQPAGLGAANAAADLHLNGEIKKFQKKLKDNILYTHLLLEKARLPNLSEKDSPIFFIGTSIPSVAYNIIEKMMSNGHYLNLGIFPAVPIKNTGVRFTITAVHSFEQIEKMVVDLETNYHLALSEEEFPIEKVYRAFKMKLPEEKFVSEKAIPHLSNHNLKVHLFDSLKDEWIEKWDSTIGKRSSFNYSALRGLQNVYSNNARIENNWNMKYLLITDNSDNVILSTFITTSLLKEDLLSPTEISIELEEVRKDVPYFMTSKVTMLGTPLTEGNHLFLKCTMKQVKLKALNLLIKELENIQKEEESNSIMLRDMVANDPDMDHLMVDLGFFKSSLPNSNTLNLQDIEIDEFIISLGKRNRKHFRDNILSAQDTIYSKVNKDPNQISKWYDLYSNVSSKNLSLNTFKVPKLFFEYVAKSDDWEIIELYSRAEDHLLGMIICEWNRDQYNPVLIGLDYEKNFEFNAYRNLLWESIKKAKSHGCSAVNFGYSAEIEKKKLGAKQERNIAYIQSADTFNQEVLMNESIESLKLAV